MKNVARITSSAPEPPRQTNDSPYLGRVKIHLILLSLTLGLIVSCSKKESAASTSPSSHELAANDFKSFIATPGTLNIVDFSATWCPPCKTLKPVLNQIANEHSDTVKLGIIDVDQAKSLAAQQGVQGIPDVRFYINGKMVDKFTGAAPKEHIEQIIATLLAKHQAELEQQEAAERPHVTPQVAQSEAPPPPLKSASAYMPRRRSPRGFATSMRAFAVRVSGLICGSM